MSAFLIAQEQGDVDGQPIYMYPPAEYEKEFWSWLARQDKARQAEFEGCTFKDVLWQLDKNLYGRRTVGFQYRERLEEILHGLKDGFDPQRHS